MKNNQFSITITPDMLQSMVRGMIEHENGDIVADVIVNHLDEFAVEQLYAAIHGIAPKCDFHVGQQVLIQVKRACGWRYDHNKQEDLLINGTYILATVIDVNPYRRDSVSIDYCLKTNDGVLEPQTMNVHPNELIVERYD